VLVPVRNPRPLQIALQEPVQVLGNLEHAVRSRLAAGPSAIASGRRRGRLVAECRRSGGSWWPTPRGSGRVADLEEPGGGPPALPVRRGEGARRPVSCRSGCAPSPSARSRPAFRYGCGPVLHRYRTGWGPLSCRLQRSGKIPRVLWCVKAD
jgi:hypothetical protein